MSTKQDVVRLTAEERAKLRARIATGRDAAWSLARARILLKADAGAAGPRWTDEQIAAAVEVSPRTVARTRAVFAAAGLAAALARQPSPRGSAHRLNGADEARLATIACSEPPAGQARWSLRLLANRLVELEVVAGISPETVRQALKKTNASRG